MSGKVLLPQGSSIPDSPRVISLVPSWTETLVEAGVDVVGRTRFCIHPQARVGDIPVVGGTKEVEPAAVDALKPDLVLLDREENPEELAETLGFPVVATHIESVHDMSPQLRELAECLKAPKLKQWAEEWEEVLAQPRRVSLEQLISGPWWREPQVPPQQLLYMIWRKPWMAVGPQTFIGSMLAHLGWGEIFLSTDEKYPVVDPQEWEETKTLVLLSSEPYPFLKRQAEVLSELAHPLAAVDGEKFSWFGLRSLRFLQSLDNLEA